MEIKNYRDINKGCLKCAFTIVISQWGGQEIDCNYFEKEGNSFWINYAPKEYTTREGQKKSFNQIRFPKEVMDQLNRAIRDKIKAKDVIYKTPKSTAPVVEIGAQDEYLPF